MLLSTKLMEVIMATAPKLIPFDPKKHKPVDAQSIGLPNSKPGQKATEYEATEIAPDGQVWNIPSVWFSAESGGWGGISLICDGCGNSTEIVSS